MNRKTEDMEGDRIEALSVLFTAGAAAGAILHSGPGQMWIPDSAAGFLLAFLAVYIILLKRNCRTALWLAWFTAGFYCFAVSDVGGVFASEERGPLTRAALSLTAGLRDAIAGIPFEEDRTESLVRALLTGDRSLLERSTTEVFRKSGASHILALSGLHLGIIYMILMKALAPLGNSPRLSKARGVFIVVLCWFYSIGTGAAPSIMRAFLFIAINETLRLLGRRRRPGTVLFSALFLQLAVSPAVIKSVGFQLSYLAICGIVFIYPKIERWFPESGGPDAVRKIWKAAALGISCQLTTAPAVWIYFKSFPPYFIMTNLLAMPVTTAVMFLSVADAAWACVGTPPEILVALNEKAVRTLIWILTVISEM